MHQYLLLYANANRYPGTGIYDKFNEEGVYQCAGCGTPLYKSTTKFNSGCGWPAFFEGLPGAINRYVSSLFPFIPSTYFLCILKNLSYICIMRMLIQPDPDGSRVEITCATCGGHLGHVFKGEGFRTPTDERHCVNSVSLKFIPGNSD